MNRQVVISPLVSLAYIIFLPFIGLGMLTVLLVEKTGEGLAKTASFGWRPVESYLTARKRKSRKTKPAIEKKLAAAKKAAAEKKVVKS